jgi:hypothetical protein
VQQILWEVLNFCVIACVCLICRPTPNSQLLAYASQLPTEDPDDDNDLHGDGEDMYDDADEGKPADGIEMTHRRDGYDFNSLPESVEYGLADA